MEPSHPFLQGPFGESWMHDGTKSPGPFEEPKEYYDCSLVASTDKSQGQDESFIDMCNRDGDKDDVLVFARQFALDPERARIGNKIHGESSVYLMDYVFECQWKSSSIYDTQFSSHEGSSILQHVCENKPLDELLSNSVYVFDRMAQLRESCSLSGVIATSALLDCISFDEQAQGQRGIGDDYLEVVELARVLVRQLLRGGFGGGVHGDGERRGLPCRVHGSVAAFDNSSSVESVVGPLSSKEKEPVLGDFLLATLRKIRNFSIVVRFEYSWSLWKARHEYLQVPSWLS
ncbi:hypothetical protein Scep_024538 [Stephania cephalantha]|uniref:Uncharacterized protein n=1 Tax=Stephania cephalantha TaxID=152367 RepID=A0AAP0F3Z0_9MAGN